MANFEALFLSVARNKKYFINLLRNRCIQYSTYFNLETSFIVFLSFFVYTELLATFFLTKVSMYLLCCNTTILKQTYIKGFILITLYDINR